MKKLGIAFVAALALAGSAHSEWGHGLGYECKDSKIPRVLQGGWDCGAGQAPLKVVPIQKSVQAAPKTTAQKPVEQAKAVPAAAASSEDLSAAFQNAKVESSGNEVKLTFSDKLFFASGSATLTPGAQAEISKLAKWLNDHPGRAVRIEGHTDSVGEAAKNQKLSDRRAQAVLKSLAKDGVQSQRVKAIGFGETKPVASNATEDGRRANRRVEVFIAK